MNGQTFVRPETRERVEAAIAALGYVPDSNARQLARTHNLYDPEPVTWMQPGANDVIAEQMLAGALRAAAAVGQSVTVVPRHREANVFGGASAGPASAGGCGCGFVVLRDGPGAAVRLSLRLRGRDLCSVAADHRMAGRLAGERLRLGGHVDALVVTDGRTGGATDARRLGLWSALAGAGGRLEFVRVPQEASDAALVQVAIERAMKRIPRPTAVVVDSVASAIGAYRGIHRLKLTIPEDVSVIAFDDGNSGLAGHVDPPLTTVETRYDLVGVLAIATLQEVVAGGGREIAVDDELLAAPRLVERSSVGMTPKSAVRTTVLGDCDTEVDRGPGAA